MIIKKNLFACILLISSCTLFYSCVPVFQYDYASYDQKLASEYIAKLKKDTLVVLIPSYSDQISIYESAIKKNPTKQEKYTKEINKLEADKDRGRIALISAFGENFSFCPVIYMYDNLIHEFEEGKEGDFFIDINGNIDPTIQYNNRTPIKLIQQFEDEWHIKNNNKILPNPFPNFYRYRNGLVYILGLESIEKISSNVAHVFDLRFQRFHNNPTKKLSY